MGQDRLLEELFQARRVYNDTHEVCNYDAIETSTTAFLETGYTYKPLCSPL